ncbi:dermonecrotic toxin domain-containing protein [Pseudomonas sp. NPDC089569]|uniref:dermonecrotic toxin domain-containing protein n=1 Tax=Pseudomonas sp. NPDC089569 TaxID=3390722 RepID=UPI003D058D89
MPSSTDSSPEKSIHHDLVKSAIPPWLSEAAPHRIAPLTQVRLTLPDWHHRASAAEHRHLKNAVRQHWLAQNKVDQMLSGLLDVQAFAEPLLQRALKERFGIDNQVKDLWLHLYSPASSDSWWVHDFASGTRSRTVSVLDAALHNFSSDETFHADSAFITAPDARGHFTSIHLRKPVNIEQFTALCRELDIGGQYARYLKDYLLPDNPLARNFLRLKVIQSQKATLRVAAGMALLKGDIGEQAHGVILGLLDDRQPLHWRGQPVHCYSLSMMDTALTGILVICADVLSATTPVPLIAYVPHDPQHPLKEYSSGLAFVTELTRQLRDGSTSQTATTNSYQMFFSQFVAQHQRGHFFAGLNNRLSQVKWHQTPAGSNLPSWRETPLDNPNLQFCLSRLADDRQTRYTGDLWDWLYQCKLNKIFNDAREIAISTAYADRMARWAWWDNLEKMLSDILNVALLVVTPFVPGLGELMLAYTAYQLTDEVIEGIVDLAQGRLLEAGEQTLGVLESVVQLGAFAAAGALGNVAKTKLSPFFEGLKPVQSADGRTRLWNPDLAPYRQPNLTLPADARPDASGVYLHQGRRILRLDNQLFEVDQDPVTAQQRIRHPGRADAYAPILRHNGHGAWVSETENPRQWEGPVLMRRLGHATDAFSDTQLEQIRLISGTEEAELRRMHLENAPPPPLLADTLQRLGTSAETAVATPSAGVALLLEDFPELPVSLAEKVIAETTEAEREHITQRKRLSLRLRHRAHELQFETLSVRAAHGLYRDTLANPDTERLVLGTLVVHSDVFADLILEVRQGSLDGELRCRIGPEGASRRHVMVRDDAGTYRVLDGAEQPDHDAEFFLPAVLHALGVDGQRTLGYGPADADLFRQWIIVKTAPPAERRILLAQPPVRAVAERETELLLRGGALTRGGVSLHERIEDLYPHFSASEVDAFADALIVRGEPMKAIEQHEDDLDELRVTLNRWEYQQPQVWGPGASAFRDGGGRHIVERLTECFERKTTELGSRTDPDSYTLDLSRELLPLDLETYWSKRPVLKKFLDKVHVLKLDNTRFSSEWFGLLKDFPNLRELSAKGCALTQLPKNIGTMPKLERLRLSDNLIVLDASAVERLKNLTRLEILRLENNPLALAPHIGRMPRLMVVALRNTGLSTWPEGTFAKPRPRGFFLDLRDNPLARIPEAVPGSPQALIIANTRLSVEHLSEIDRLVFQTLRRSNGLPAEPFVDSTEQNPSLNQFPTASQWNDVPGWGIDRDVLWLELIDEPDARQFVSTLIETQNSADFRAGGQARENLLQRVWRTMDAVYIDTRLRQKLFLMAIDPVRCADAGAQLFNNMGIEVLASEARSYSISAEQTEQKLVTLAKGAARLDMVNEIARADMASRSGDPDEVEVYLAYQTGLARRLDLPWQSQRMLFRPVSGVSDEMIDQASDTVLALSEGDGLVNRMLEQAFWQDWLQERYPVRMESNKRGMQNKFEQLDDLQTAQRRWAGTRLTEEQRAALKQRLTTLMEGFSIPQTAVLCDEPISESLIDRLLVELGEEEKQLARTLTRTAMNKAGV